MTRLSIFLLGSFSVTLDNKQATGFESDKVRALLAYLSMEADRPHRRVFLAGLFWPEWSDSTARTNLRKALYNLRHVIYDTQAGVPYLLITSETIQINNTSDIWLDVQAFEHFQADNLPPGSSILPIEDLTSGLSLYRGQFLEDFALKDCQAFDDWANITRERLRIQALAALSHLAEYHAQFLSYEKAIGYTRRQLELSPWDETAHQRLMRLLALNGQRSAALAQYKACQRNLADELNTRPGVDTVKLYEQIRNGNIGKRVDETPRHNLPTHTWHLVGREKELAEIADRLQDSGCRLISLIGHGGIGKTRLAIEVAARNAHHFRHGVFFVPLAQVPTVNAILPNIAQTVGFTYQQEALPEQEFLDFLQLKHMLLILDNFEHLLPGSGWIQEILHSAPGVKFLVTSRFRLDLQDEHLLLLGGLDYPTQDLNPGESGQYILRWPAVQLFIEGARRVRAGYDPPYDDSVHIAHICQMVDGMPLAILLAASWMVVLSPEEIESQIQASSLDFLKTNWRDVPERQRSLRAMFDHSWSLLSQRDKENFTGLAVFRGGFKRTAAQNVVGMTLREISSLVEKALVHTAGDSRYDLHELLHQYAAIKLLETPDGGRAVNERHSRYYLSELRQLATDLRTFRQQKAAREMAAELDNSRAAWFWAARHELREELGLPLDGLCGFYEWHNRYQEGEQICQEIVLLLKETSRTCSEAETDTRSIILARALAWHGRFNRLLGHTQAARQSLEEGLAVLSILPLERCDTRSEKAELLQQMGHLIFITNPRDSQKYIEQSITLFRELSNQPKTAQALILLGENFQHQCLYPRAKELVAEGLAIMGALGDRLGAAVALRVLNSIAVRLGDLDEGFALAQESLSNCCELGDQVGIADSLIILGNNQCFNGQFSEARATHVNAASIIEGLGYRNGLLSVYWCMSWVEFNLGDYEKAHQDNQASIAIAREMGHHIGIAQGLWGEGIYAITRGDYAHAEKFLLEGAILYRNVKERDELGLLLGDMANVEAHLGKGVRARRHLIEALKIAARTGSWQTKVLNLANAAVCLAINDEPSRAIELYTLASRYPYVGKSLYWEDVAGKVVSQAAKALPAIAVSEAQRAGQEDDLDTIMKELLHTLMGRVVWPMRRSGICNLSSG